MWLKIIDLRKESVNEESIETAMDNWISRPVQKLTQFYRVDTLVERIGKHPQMHMQFTGN